MLVHTAGHFVRICSDPYDHHRSKKSPHRLYALYIRLNQRSKVQYLLATHIRNGFENDLRIPTYSIPPLQNSKDLQEPILILPYLKHLLHALHKCSTLITSTPHLPYRRLPPLRPRPIADLLSSHLL